MRARKFSCEGEESKHGGEEGQEPMLAVGEDQPMQHQHGNQDRDGHLVQHSTADGISV